MSRSIGRVAVLALATLALAACGGDEGGQEPAGAEGAGGDRAVSIEISEQNGSGQSGTATLSPVGTDKTTVVVQLGGPAPADPQPAHIHPGTCEELDATPKYPLKDLMDGRSETTVEASLEDLQSEEFALNVHKSAAEIQTYVACGNLTGGGGGGTGSSY